MLRWRIASRSPKRTRSRYANGQPSRVGAVRRDAGVAHPQRSPVSCACDRQRAGGQPVRRLGLVVAGRRDVVRAVRVEDRREVLDLPAARAELELPAAVHADAALPRTCRTCWKSRRSGPKRLGLTFTIFGANGSASTSSTLWMFASQVMRSRWGSSAASVSGVSFGSSIHASGNASAMRA